MDARVGPALFPVIEVGLGFVQSLEAQTFQRCFLRVTDARFNFLCGRDLVSGKA